MISWGLEVNDYGNAILDPDGQFIKVQGEGVTEEMWADMVSQAEAQGLSGGNFKKLNLPFENKLASQPEDIRERMAKAVEDFIYNILVHVFNAEDTAPLAIDALLRAGSYDLGPKGTRIEEPSKWTESKIVEKAKLLGSDKGPQGDFDD